MNKSILFIADARSVHSERWINYIRDNSEFAIRWISIFPPRNSSNNNSNIIVLKDNSVKNTLRAIYNIIFRPPDIMHIHYVGFHSLLAIFLSKKKSLILNTWGSDLVFSQKNILRKIWLTYILKKCSCVISDAYHHYEFLKKYNLKKSKFKYIPYGTDTKFYKSTSAPFSNKNINVIHTRNLETIYDVQTFLNAASIVLKEINSVRFTIVGSGPLERDLTKLSKKLKIDKKVRFLGRVNQKEMFKELNSSDIYVSCALRDGGLASSTAEAMSCERLVIISNNSDNNQWIINNKNGYLFDNGDYFDLGKIILSAISNKEESIKIGKQGRKIILQKNSYVKQMNKVLNIYEDQIGKN